MSEMGQQATILGGEQAPPATGLPNGGSQPAPAATSAPAPASNGTGQAPASWFASGAYTDEDRAFLTNKGWNTDDGHYKAVKSYRELEKVLGGKANAVLIPKPGDVEAEKEFYSKLGVPDSPDKYGFSDDFPAEIKDGLNPEMTEWYRGVAHKHKMTPQQFQGVIADYEVERQRQEGGKVQAHNGEVAQVVEKFRTEFGDGFTEQIARGNLAMQKLGISKDDMGELQYSLGVERANRLMFKLGEMLAPHKTVGMGGGNTAGESFVTDKARAQASIGRIQRGDDPNFKKAMLDPQHPDHKNTVAQWREWNRIANS